MSKVSRSSQALTAQLHIIASRGPVSDFIDAMIKDSPIHKPGERLVDLSTIKSNSRRASLERLNRPRKVPSPWTYRFVKGHIQLMLPQEWQISQYMYGQLANLAEVKSEFFSQPKRNVYRNKTLLGQVHCKQMLSCSQVRLLTITSKMGAMSWNLPAGPIALGGSCDGSVPGWRPRSYPLSAGRSGASDADFNEGRELQQHWDEVNWKSPSNMSVRVSRAPKPLKKSLAFAREIVGGQVSVKTRRLAESQDKHNEVLKQYYGLADVKTTKTPNAEDEVTMQVTSDGQLHQVKINPGEYICNACYALKGSYGNPSNILNGTLRKKWVDWCLRNDPQEFVDVMTISIEAARQTNAAARKRAAGKPPKASDIKQERVLEHPDPDFFRIHDSGDWFDARYLQLWLQVIDRFPKVKFWSPTRLWWAPNIVKKLDATLKAPRPGGKSGLPGNLILRPSALHFGDPPVSHPRLCGQPSGSGSADPDLFTDKATGKVLQCVHAGQDMLQFICPAYLPYTQGGGRLHKVKDGRRLPVFEDGGSCQIAKGIIPGSAACRAPKQRPCRVCWENTNVHVVYSEH